MAIKVSNQITFTEHKKIIEIKEWYLATSDNKNVTHHTNGWSTDIPTIDGANRYLWNYEEIVYSLGSSDISDPVIIGVYGDVGPGLQIKYISSATTPTIVNNNVSEWSDAVPSQQEGHNVYMTQKLSSSTDWSAPIQISSMAAPTIEIVNGYWYVNGEPTDIKAEGETPSITVGANGNWHIDGVDSGTKAQGESGKDGTSIEYVYYRSKEEAKSLAAPYYTNGILTVGWTASPQGITEIYKYEYVSIRTKPTGGEWGSFSTPVVWSKWGEKGQDGDGIQYEYYLTNESDVNKIPSWTTNQSVWTDEPQGVAKDKQYEYVVQIKTTASGSTVSSPSLWAKYGEDGVGISNIKNYYTTTSDVDLPASPDWTESAPPLSTSNKYLWNYEVITYTDNSSTSTDPAIIGVYGDSGTSAITFEVYSVNGFMFKESLKSIELKIAAFDGTDPIDDIEYTWSWWDDSLNDGNGGYSEIITTNERSFIIKESDKHAFASIKCTMNYNNSVYEDYVVLTSETVIYNAVVKFFNGSNIFSDDDLYLVAYIELYQNNNKIDTISAPTYCSGISSASSDGDINTSLKGSFLDGDKMYFICQNDDMTYYAILGKYTSSTGKWIKVEDTSLYTYTNSLYVNDRSKVVVISKESINKSQNVDFIVYKNGEHIADASAMVIDSNDPIISAVEPDNPVNKQLWLDTSSTPYVLKIYTNGEWVKCSDQTGGAVFTSKPTSYSSGDLWVLAVGESCNGYKAGSMLKATTSSNTFNSSHWIDADSEYTQLKNDIQQYLTFDAKTGLTISDTKADADADVFSVNISSTSMTFRENDTPVVSISNESAQIDNLTVENGLTSDGSTTLNGDTIMQKTTNNKTYKFIWKVEDSNGSLSLVISD